MRRHKGNVAIALGLLALFVSMTGTVGALPGAGSVDRNDLKPGVVGFKNLRPGAVKGNRVADGSIGSAKVAGLTGDDLSDGSIEPRHLNLPVSYLGSAAVHGQIDAAGDEMHTAQLNDATHPSTGIYCLAPTGAAKVNADFAELLVSLDFSESTTTDGSNLLAHIEARGRNEPGCPAGYWQVRTFELSESAGVIDVAPEDQGFFFAFVYESTD